MKMKNMLIFWVWITLGLITGCAAPQAEPTATSTEKPLPTLTSTATPEPTPEPSLTPTKEPTEAPVQDPVFGLNLDISEGIYQDGIYTPDYGNFSCAFGPFITSVPYPNLLDNTDGDIFGAVWSLDGYGQSFAIDYFRYSALSTDRKELLEDPQTRQEGYLKLYTDMLLPYHQSTFPGLEILDQGFVDEETLYVVWNKPQGSHLFTNNAYEDVQEIYYIMVKGDWFYFASFFRTPSVSETVFDIDQMQDRLNNFLAGCEFNS